MLLYITCNSILIMDAMLCGMERMWKMKNMVCKVVFLCTAALVCSSCSGKSVETSSTVQAAIDKSGIATAADSFDQTAAEFIECLQNADIKALASMADLRSEKAWDFLKELDITDTAISSGRIIGEGNEKEYEVTLYTSGGTGTVIPQGESKWLLRVRYEAYSSISLFCPLQEDRIILTDMMSVANNDDLVQAASFCYRMSVEFNCFDTLTDIDKLRPAKADKQYMDQFVTAAIRLLIDSSEMQLRDGKTEVSRSLLEQHLLEKLGIGNIDLTKSSLYNSRMDTLELISLSGLWSYVSMTELEWDPTQGAYTVQLEYYADSCGLVKAKTMRYVMLLTEKGQRLQSVECLYDSGFQPVRRAL